jgi:signal peptidase II
MWHQNKKNRYILLTCIACAIILLDQLLKIYIKTHMAFGDEFNILGLSWARIHFVENSGMAFGLSYGGTTGKYILSVIRIGVMLFLFWLIRGMLDQNQKTGALICFAMILAGAIGNIIDSMFYGLIFTATPYHTGGISSIVPFGHGYAPFLQGKVVDMLYFPLVNTQLPEWMPIVGGHHFEFFQPVFNIADASISTGMIALLLFYRDVFREKIESVKTQLT